MHVLTCMARPVDKEVPVSYFDFMTRDSVSRFLGIAVILFCLPLFPSFYFIFFLRFSCYLSLFCVCFVFLFSYYCFVYYYFCFLFLAAVFCDVQGSIIIEYN